MERDRASERGSTFGLRGARTVVILAALAGLTAAKPARAAEPPEPALSATETLPAYGLGEEIVPNGDFDPVAPLWRQIRPDEGEQLAVVPEGWRAGHQGGERRFPIPGVDPETHDRCMVFLHGAGSVSLISPPLALQGPGAYALSMRIRSVVAPAPAALRAVIRIRAGDDADPPAERVVERRFPAGPEERRWRRWAAIVSVPPGVTGAEIHLVKHDVAADFLVDDVSLRKITQVPREIRLSPPPEGRWTSPVVYAGALRALALARGPGERIEVRTGTTAEPGDGWTAWRSIDPGSRPREGASVPLAARGVPIYLQARAGGGADARRGEGLLFLAEPWEEKTLSPDVTIEAIPRDPPGDIEAWREIQIPAAGECTSGKLASLRAVALEAIAGIEGDLPRARAITARIGERTSSTAGGPPPEGEPRPGPAAILADCSGDTPLHCDAWRQDLATAACVCAGLLCRPASLRGSGGSAGGSEGIEVWSNEMERWIWLPLGAGGAGEEPRSPAAASPAVESAAEWSARTGRAAAVSTDLRWGERAWRIQDPATAPGERRRDAAADPAPTDFPVNFVRVEIEPSGDRALSLALSHGMPAFSRYEVRFAPGAAWRSTGERFAWPLSPGENLVEIRALNAMGVAGPVSRIRALRWIDPETRSRPYAGLRPLGGDPHVHTGLAIYSILDPDHPLATGDVARVFESARANGLHWAAVTDYAQSIDDPRSLALRKDPGRWLSNPDGSRTPSEWAHAKAVVDAADRPGDFAAFLGVEYDGGGYRSKGGTGRKIVLLPDTGPGTWCSSQVFNVGDCPVVEDAFRYARDHRGVMIAASPCAASGGEDTDWSRHDPVVALLEIEGGACERGPGGLVDVTTRLGLRAGAGGGSKSRAAEAGLNDRTICWAEGISRGEILEALRARRCYWSAAGHLDLAFTLDGAVMGAEVAPGVVTSWSITATNVSAPAFDTVEILHDGEVVASAACASASRCSLEGGMGEPLPGVWYAAINDAQGLRLALTSPVFVTGTPSR